MHHYTLAEAQAIANDLNESVRIIAFDFVPSFEGEEACTKYAIVNTQCTFEEMRMAGYKNPRICIYIHPQVDRKRCTEFA